MSFCRRQPPRALRQPRLDAGPDLRRDQKGAVIVEFAMAIMPVFFIFFGTLQWCACAYVNLLVRHSAFVAARCEAVVHPQMPDSGPADDCKTGINMLLLTALPEKATIRSTLPTATSQQILTTQVELDFKCKVPLGDVLACGRSRQQHFTASASFPNQGSAYQKIWY
jgi:hypothetical protein